MEDKGAFVWKIDNFLGFEVGFKESPAFKFGEYECLLDIDEVEDDADYKIYRVFLHEFNGKLMNYKTSCKLCLIDGRGEEFLVTKRTTLKFESYIHLMTILYSDLRCQENHLLLGGVLTLRLSWCDKEENNSERGTRLASDLNTEKEPSKLLQTLSKDFTRLYECKVGSDFLLRVGEVTIPVHRIVLSTRSEVFADMFRQDTSEIRSGVVDIPGVDVAVLSDILYYVYSGQTRGISADTIVSMYAVADKYALIELKDACLDVFMRSLTVENVCDAALLAHTHGETKLEEEVVQFIKENFEELEVTDKWKELLRTESSLAFNLLRSAFMIYKHKDNSSSSK